MRKKLLSILCVLALVVSMAGCGGGGSDSGDSGEGGSTAKTAGNVSDSIVRYTLTELPQIDPGVTSDFGGATILVNVYDPLVMLNGRRRSRTMDGYRMERFR